MGVPNGRRRGAETLDRDLVEQAQRGDREAFAILARTHGDRLMSIAQRILRDVGRAEDAVQLTLVIAWRELPNLRVRATFTTRRHASGRRPGRCRSPTRTTPSSSP
ncbi:MAG: RNA polymerase sigma factor [Chloroflexota bacterium]